MNDYTFTKWESDDDRIVIYVEGSDYGFGWGFLKDEDTEYQGPYFVRFLSPSNIGPYFSMSMENGPHWSYILKRIKNIEEWDGVLEAYQGSKLQFKFIPTKIIEEEIDLRYFACTHLIDNEHEILFRCENFTLFNTWTYVKDNEEYTLSFFENKRFTITNSVNLDVGDYVADYDSVKLMFSTNELFPGVDCLKLDYQEYR